MSRSALPRRPALPDADSASASPITESDPPPAVLPVPAPADLTPDEWKAFDVMPPPLQARVLEIRGLMRNEMVTLLDSRYQLGSLVLEIKQNPETYGPMSDIQMEEFFGTATKTVYGEARRIRERYPPEEFEKVKSAVNPDNGARISYTHLAILLRVEDDARADKLLRHCLEAGWSTKELAAAVDKTQRELFGPKPKSRPKPANFLGVVENMTATGASFRRQYDEVWREGAALTDAFAALPAEQIDESVVEGLEELTDQFKSVAEAAGFVVTKAGRLLACARETIRRRRQVVEARGDEE